MPKYPLLIRLLTTPAIAAQPIDPGQWEFTNTVTAVEMPNAQPGLIQAMIGKTTTVRHCITPEQAKAGLAVSFKPKPECTLTNPDSSGATLDTTLVCKANDGAVLTMTTHGTVTPDSFTGTSQVDMAGALHMTQHSTVTAHRTGPASNEAPA